MRFALLGDHPHGLAMARALAATGRHALIVYSGPRPGLDACRSFAPDVKSTPDLEEVLADPAVELVVVAGRAGQRVDVLRRALQSERAVLCVHPLDPGPDAAYEAAMIQTDTRQLLLPLLVEAFHPGIARLIDTLPALGGIHLLELEIASRGPTLLDVGQPDHEASLPGWHLLRRLGGEVAEVSAFGQSEELAAELPLLVSGRFEKGGLFELRLLPMQAEDRWSLRLVGARGTSQLDLPGDGSARLSGPEGEASWPPFDRWAALVEMFEESLSLPAKVVMDLSWQDEVRCLELDDAARTSLERRRATLMHYQDASEEVGFKGTMTLVGCALLWSILAILFLSIWFPRLGWVIAPILGTFLLLQFLRWIIPRPPDEPYR
jgi:predicted dehydrogenase